MAEPSTPSPTVELAELMADRRRGSIAIALDAARLLAALPPAERPAVATALVDAHPAMAPLRHLAEAPDPAAFAAELKAHVEAAADRAARTLAGCRVLTISASGLVEEALRRAEGVEIHCLRSEPGGEGADLAARLGARLWADEDLVAAARHADVGLTGADAVGPSRFVNKVGTGALCRALPTLLLEVPEKSVARDSLLVASDRFEIVPLDVVTRI